ncbi:MAG: long-chain fatty acid--CoA ligase [Leptospirales bacterium]|nr:long-chain fatty acid--CoA ligase [Leptospirales bacterium]
MKPKQNPTNLAEVYRQSAERFGDTAAFCTRNEEKKFVPITFRELYEAGVNLATALIDLGVKARDHVVILADNRREWIIADYGTILCGAADVPRGTDVTDGDVQYIVPHSDARVVFVENGSTLSKVQRNLNHLTDIRCIIVMDDEGVSVGHQVMRMTDLISKGRELRSKGDKRVEDRMAGIKPDDLFTIIYTSGTTGAPKGVMLTHANMISQLVNIPIDIGPGDRFLSILPVWHSFERVFEMGTIARGATQYYSNVRNIREDMRLVQPTFMASAPRLWESVHQGIQAKVQSSPLISRVLFRAAYFCAQRVKRAIRFLRGNQLDLEGRNPIWSFCLALWHIPMVGLFFLPHLALDAIVLRKIRAATGGELRGTVSGGGALPFHIDEFFNTIGIPVYEGYGLTETSPGLAFRTPGRLVLGSVGAMFPQTELRLVDVDSRKIIYPPTRGVKGEVHVRGPQVMKGYYKASEMTARVLTGDGWFNTGDLGLMTYNNTLKLVGRSKETVVLLNGENVEPVPIENKIMQSPLIDHVMIVGQDKNFLGALVVPVLDRFKEHGSTHEDLARSEEVRRAILKEVRDSVTSQNGFKAFERVNDVRLLPKTFEVGDELSAKMSMKRHIITEKYQTLIESMYI